VPVRTLLKEKERKRKRVRYFAALFRKQPLASDERSDVGADRPYGGGADRKRQSE
jgi:hypothetical protein